MTSGRAGARIDAVSGGPPAKAICRGRTRASPAAMTDPRCLWPLPSPRWPHTVRQAPRRPRTAGTRPALIAASCADSRRSRARHRRPHRTWRRAACHQSKYSNSRGQSLLKMRRPAWCRLGVGAYRTAQCERLPRVEQTGADRAGRQRAGAPQATSAERHQASRRSI